MFGTDAPLPPPFLAWLEEDGDVVEGSIREISEEEHGDLLRAILSGKDPALPPPLPIAGPKPTAPTGDAGPRPTLPPPKRPKNIENKPPRGIPGPRPPKKGGSGGKDKESASIGAPRDEETAEGDGDTPGGSDAAATVGTIGVFALVGSLVWAVWRRKKKRR